MDYGKFQYAENKKQKVATQEMTLQRLQNNWVSQSVDLEKGYQIG